MTRSLWIIGCVFLAATQQACGADLRCSGGAVEINRLCECPPLTEDVRGECKPLVADGGADVDGGGTTADAGGGDGGQTGCSPKWLVCGVDCVNPREDKLHCGGCGLACADTERCSESKCVPDVGCSDGTREAFQDVRTFTSIAGCAATWPSISMRAPRQQAACGLDSNRKGLGCDTPADACSKGWHVCGNEPIDLIELMSLDAKACSSQPGRFAMSLDASCAGCSNSASRCCGTACIQAKSGGAGECGASVFDTGRCDTTESARQAGDIGVMCCRDTN